MNSAEGILVNKNYVFEEDFVILGEPIAKARPRFFKRGDFVGTYNSQRTEEGRFLFHVKEGWRRDKPLEGALCLYLGFYFKRPRSHFGTGRNANKLKPSAPKHPSSKNKDLDNLIKFVLDCFNGIVFVDDKQVVEIIAFKAFGDQPRTYVSVRSVLRKEAVLNEKIN